MNLRKNLVLIFFVVTLVILVGIGSGLQKSVNERNLEDGPSKRSLNNDRIEDQVPFLNSYSLNNLDIVNEMFDARLNEYSTLGYFPQIYESSLQATYYGLYILNALGKLDYVDGVAITDYIMSHYNVSSGIFLDRYALRYLDTDFYQAHFPYTSLLEVNCYAILSLEVLCNLSLIDTQKSINFIWDCYNPSTSGFIGREYSVDLPEKFKISTMDNTYSAILTLDLLMQNWDGYSGQKTDLMNYINNLQSTSTWEWKKGGFSNDDDPYFFSLEMFEPNMLSSYYCVKSLGMFGLEGTIRTEDFRQYLTGIYNETEYFFQMHYDYSFFKEQDIVATALGLQLSGYLDSFFLDSANQTGVINFILNNRNDMGNWDSSSQIKYHELMDTFQIIRALSETGVISQLSEQDREEVANAISNYFHYDRFSLLSEDYTSMELLNAIVSAFELYDRISDLDIQGIYDSVRDSCYPNEYLRYYFFTGSTNMDPQLLNFRTWPIEYYNLGYFNYLKELNELKSHKYTFMALDTLYKLFKLDDLDYYLQNCVISSNLSELLDSIIETQFLNQSCENYGAFLPSLSISNLQSHELQNKRVFFEYSYYAIKALKLLADYLSLGDVKDLNFNRDALFTYIESHNRKVETSSQLYFNPHSFNDLDAILQNTYYMIYVLKEIDYLSNLDTLKLQKLNNFVVQNLDYTNIKNIYYSYKISEILGFNISFSLDLTHELVKQIYSEQLNEFFLTADNKVIDQEIFLWITEMAKNDKIRINAHYPATVMLGENLHINATLCNIILESFDANTLVKFESEQMGTIDLVKQDDNSYVILDGNNFISVNPNNYPILEGKLCVYEGPQKIQEIPVLIQTTYDLEVNSQVSKGSNSITIVIDVSLVTGVGPQPLFNGKVFADVYRNNDYIETLDFSSQELPQEERTEFSLTYIVNNPGDYAFKVYLDDTFEQNYIHILDASFIRESDDSEGSKDSKSSGDSKDSGGSKSTDDSKNNDATLINAIPLIISFIAIPSGVIGLSTKFLRKSKTK